MTIRKQGTVVTTGGIIYTPPLDTLSNISNIKITNTASSPYTISLYRSTPNHLKTLLYKFILASGDNVDDDTEYKLEYGDYLWLLPSVSTVNYTLEGLEMPI